jgi:hypothetical protein
MIIRTRKGKMGGKSRLVSVQNALQQSKVPVDRLARLREAH